MMGSSEQLRWVGGLSVFGLIVVALGFVGCRSRDNLSHAPPATSTLPSASDGAPGPSPLEGPAPLLAPMPVEEAAPVPREQPRVAPGDLDSPNSAL
jgi:hypothetical protein